MSEVAYKTAGQIYELLAILEEMYVPFMCDDGEFPAYTCDHSIYIGCPVDYLSAFDHGRELVYKFTSKLHLTVDSYAHDTIMDKVYTIVKTKSKAMDTLEKENALMYGKIMQLIHLADDFEYTFDNISHNIANQKEGLWDSIRL